MPTKIEIKGGEVRRSGWPELRDKTDRCIGQASGDTCVYTARLKLGSVSSCFNTKQSQANSVPSTLLQSIGPAKDT